MRRRGHLHRVTIGRTREVRGPDAMERAAAGLIILVAMASAVGFGARHIRMVQSLDAVVLASATYYDSVVYRSVHGTWPSPDPDILGGNFGGRYADNISLDPGGGITAELRLDAPVFAKRRGSTAGRGQHRGLLSLRPERLGARDFPAFTLLCGYATPLAAGRVQAASRTTVARSDLPPFCR
jgi:hypothetical protein